MLWLHTLFFDTPQSQLSEQAFIQGGLDKADWRQRRYIPPSVDEAVDVNEASQFDEGRVSPACPGRCDDEEAVAHTA